MASGQLHIVAPGLLGPMKSAVDLEALPAIPVVERLLGRADQTPFAAADFEETLFQLFNISHSSDGDLPVAALNRLGDNLPADERYWLQINPVFLRPDQGRLLLFDSVDLDLSLDESQQLADAFRQHFAEQNWQLEVVTPHRWYLAMHSVPALQTSPIEQVFGRSIDHFLPRGEDALFWHGLMNEVQMLFHTVEVNQLREQRGKLPINGIWLSGGGILPPKPEASFDKVLTDNGLVWGLAQLSSSQWDNLPTQGALPLEGNQLCVYDDLLRPVLRADPYDWSDALECFNNWLEPLAAQLNNGQLKELLLYPCDGHRYRLTRGTLRRFWRRSTPLTTRLLDH
ncbi:MAG: phosphoglycerate mutase [Chromatiales bacterium]|nr:phosphoglycerate mutase [Chromatiales bacterium]